MSKKLILSLALSGLVLTATAQTTVAPAIPRDEKIEQQIETLLKKMTLDEKVGQMCELTIDLLQNAPIPLPVSTRRTSTVKDLTKIIKRSSLKGIQAGQGDAFAGCDDEALYAYPRSLRMPRVSSWTRRCSTHVIGNTK